MHATKGGKGKGWGDLFNQGKNWEKGGALKKKRAFAGEKILPKMSRRGRRNLDPPQCQHKGGRTKKEDRSLKETSKKKKKTEEGKRRDGKSRRKKQRMRRRLELPQNRQTSLFIN